MNALTNDPSSASDRIRRQLERVTHLRTQAQQDGLSTAVHQVKQLQARRFRATYTDFLTDPRHAAATTFFLDELYGEHDFAQRDAQFGRIAGAIERLFPEAVADLAVDLAETHALTESLDHQLAGRWLDQDNDCPYTERYVRSWRQTGERAARQRQLAVVLHMGQELQRLTRMKSLLIALKLMRGPAQAAGLASLQQFLERGFSAFATMGDARHFLAAIAEREQRWIDALFDDDLPACQAALARELQRA
ncbi:MAG: FFLEELY motif protein [Hydrogenophaga sp.]|uniref:FFLEELY motif protein n=1 Tax=Hydrogenophaga sp. TaxID=1904254 RepID=UPI003D9B7324